MLTDIILTLLVIVLIVLVLSGRSKSSDSTGTLKVLGDMLSQNQKDSASYQQNQLRDMDKNITEKQGEMNKAVLDSLSQMENRFKTFEQSNEQRLESMRDVMMKSLISMREDNEKRLEDMRKTVDEKLQKSLDENLTKSFSMVSERLEQVYKGLGEMQTLASGVGDLKKMMSNVKTRGILGEIQLASILREILSPEQYDENVITVPGSKNPVEFAIKLPGNDGTVYLPIDSKFPGDAFYDLQTAYESCDKEAIKACTNTLLTRIKMFAKDIHDKYIEPPYTTDFAIMFLPFEGLYSEVVNQGMVEVLQSTYKVNIAGPSTMAALLNSLQMGFKTLAIQKRSAEVWNVLASVKSEFDTFGAVLDATQKRLDQANKELDKLVGVRTRAIIRKLKDVQDASIENSLPSEDTTVSAEQSE